MKTSLSLAALATTGLLTLSTSTAAVLILNPGFEDPVHAGNNGTNPTGWVVIETATGSNPDRQVRTRNNAVRSGQMAVQLGAGNSNHDGELFQTVVTEIGQSYTFSIWARSFGTNNPGDQNPIFDLRDGSGTAGSVLASSGAITSLNPAWAEYTVDFTALSTETTIHIQDVSTAPTNDGNDIVLDDVSITAIPEPQIALLGIIGITCSVLRRRRS